MHEGAGEPSVPSFHGSKWPSCCGNSSSATAGPGCRGRAGCSSCPRFCDTQGEGPPWGRSCDSRPARSRSKTPSMPSWSTTTLLTPPGGSTSPPSAAWPPRSARGPPLATFPVRSWPDGFAPATVPRRRRPGTGSEVAPLWWTPVPATLVFAVIACWLVLSGCRVLAACSPPAPRVLVLTVALIVTFSGRS
jgi:hypothetical protein